MSIGRTVGAIGVVVAVGSAVVLGRDEASRGLAVPVALLAIGTSALIAEVVRSLRIRRPVVPDGAKPADGVVEVVPVGGIEATPNPDSPRYREFARLREPAGASEVVRNLPRESPTLLGRVALISVFVGRDGRDWTVEEIARGHAALERAGAWIEREAIRYGAPVNLGLAEVYFRVRDDEDDEVEVGFAGEGDDFGPMEARASMKAIVAASRAAAALGFGDVVDLVRRVNSRVEADAAVWLLHVRRSGRSLAIPAEASEIPGVGLAVCFSREASFPGPLTGPGRVDPTTVAHELLHLFGASDKYGVPLRSFPTGSVSPREVMRLNHDRLAGLTIDPLTAGEIGWDPGQVATPSTKKARRQPG